MVKQIIDCHNHVINQREPVWGWGPSFTIERLIETMDRDYDIMGEIRHIDKAILMTGLGLTSLDDHTIDEAFAYPFEGIKKYPDRLFFNPVINPRTWVPDGLSKIEAWADEYNIVMLKIHPSMHNYHLPGAAPYPNENDKKMIYPIFELARSMGVPVMIHMGETPYSVPANMAPIARAFPDVPMICAHSGANNIPGNALDALLLARTHENVYLGNSWVQPQDWNQIYYGIGASRMVFESDCSPLSLGQMLRLVTNLHLPPPLGVGASENEVYQVIGGNIAELCNLSA